MNNKFNEIKIHTISPINIGNGEEFSPLSFWIDEKNKKLIEFNEYDFINTLSAEEIKSIYDICKNPNKSSMAKLYSLIFSKKPKGYRSIDISDFIIEKYSNSKSGINSNQFQIKRTITNPNTHKTFIPGSSLKGAIRTSFINSLVNKQSLPEINEREILKGSFSNDPFTTLKVSDLLVEKNGETEILFSLRMGKKKDSCIPVMLEVIKSDSVFIGSISININIKTNIKFDSIEELLLKTDKYYQSIINDRKIGILNTIKDKISQKRKIINNKTFICRLGSFIGAESHTIENNRKIYIKGINKTLSYSTTYLKYSRDSKTPIDSFGWCLIELVGVDKNINIEEQNKKEEQDYKKKNPINWG